MSPSTSSLTDHVNVITFQNNSNPSTKISKPYSNKFYVIRYSKLSFSNTSILENNQTDKNIDSTLPNLLILLDCHCSFFDVEILTYKSSLLENVFLEKQSTPSHVPLGYHKQQHSICSKLMTRYAC